MVNRALSSARKITSRRGQSTASYFTRTSEIFELALAAMSSQTAFSGVRSYGDAPDSIFDQIKTARFCRAVFSDQKLFTYSP
jgi:hypothetical protein